MIPYDKEYRAMVANEEQIVTYWYVKDGEAKQTFAQYALVATPLTIDAIPEHLIKLAICDGWVVTKWREIEASGRWFETGEAPRKVALDIPVYVVFKNFAAIIRSAQENLNQANALIERYMIDNLRQERG